MDVLEASADLHSLPHRTAASRFTVPCAHARLRYRGRPLVMGILNVTPDSFSDGGAYLNTSAAIEQGRRMADEGADLIDIGGESTRPGAKRVIEQEEVRRVLPVVRALAAAVPVPLSVDTSKAEVARQALEAGASLVNDVTALRGDQGMAATVAEHGAAVILMHMRGTPGTMQQRPRYRNVGQEIATFLTTAAARAQEAGIPRARILLDPGLGFGKTVRHNLQLLSALRQFTALGYPVVIGPSRKSFIGATVNAPAHDRLAGTLACVAVAQQAGAHLVRVHDVRPTVQFLQMLDAVQHP